MWAIFKVFIEFVNPKGNQSWIFIGRTDAETPILWPADAKSWFIRKDPDAGKDWTQEEKGSTEDKMVGWHHRLNGYDFGQIPGDSEGQGSLACCSSWGCKESDMAEQLNNNNKVSWSLPLIHWRFCPLDHCLSLSTITPTMMLGDFKTLEQSIQYSGLLFYLSSCCPWICLLPIVNHSFLVKFKPEWQCIHVIKFSF